MRESEEKRCLWLVVLFIQLRPLSTTNIFPPALFSRLIFFLTMF